MWILAVRALAGLSPESVAVVVNGDSWASLAVANEYAHLRHIPDRNFIVLHGLSSFDITDVERFRVEVLTPVFATLDERGLAGQIDCIAYSLDIPSAVVVSGDMAGKPFAQIITPVAATNGLTYLHEWVRRKDCDYLRLDINRYCRRTLPLVSGQPLTAEERGEYQRGMTLYDAKKYDEAASAIAKLTTVKRGDPSMLYNLACCLALAGKADDAVAALREATAQGWRNHGQTTSDPDLASLAKRDDFAALVAEMKAAKIEVQPTRGFRASIGWNDAGEPAGGDDKIAPRYMLSTMLGVASGRGNSVAEVLECLRRSAAADGAAPRGTVYFMKNGDVRSTTRDWAFPFAAEQISAAGVACRVEDGILPAAHTDVAGALIGIAEFRWGESKSTILPGAICEHLTSCGGMMGERDGQTPCTDLIRAGAAGTSGAVTEPYALQEKFPDAFMHLHYVRGSTLAEAFYQSLRGPYQLLIIGDPLCRPWGLVTTISEPTVAPEAPAAKSGVKKSPPPVPAALRGRVELHPKSSGDAKATAEFVLFVDGKRVTAAGPGATLALDTTKLDDGEHELSVVSRATDAVAGCSRFQRTVRIANGARSLRIVSAPGSSVAFGDKIKLELDCPGAKAIDVLHLGRVVASLDQAKGVVMIDTTKLGTGPVALLPVGRYFPDTGRVRGPRVEVMIDPPAAIAGVKPAASGSAKKGLTLTVAGRSPVVVGDTFSGDWLAKALAQASQPSSAASKGSEQTFVLEGDFVVERPDVYQIQIRGNTHARVEISGREVLTTREEAWSYGVVQLAAGTHRLRVSGKAGGDPRLDIRLGAQGTAHPSEARFSQAQ